MKKTLVAVALVMLMAASADAALIRLQLAPAGATQMTDGYDPTAAAADSVFGATGGLDMWDLRASSASTTQTYSDLLDTSTGLGTGISITLRPGNGVENQNGTTAGGKNVIGAQYMFNNETFTISGLVAGQEVHLLGYGLSNRNWGVSFTQGTGEGQIVESSVSQFLLGQHVNNATLNALTVTPYGTSLTGTWWQGSEEGGGRVHVMAMQIYQVPEPATMSVLVLGGIATLLKRRNRR